MSKACADRPGGNRRPQPWPWGKPLGQVLLAALLLFAWPVALAWSAEPGVDNATMDLDFDIPEVEKKLFEFGGYLEARETVLGLNKHSLLYRQKYAGQQTADQQFVTNLAGKLEGKAQTGIASAYARFKLGGQKDVADGWVWDNTFEEAFVALKPSPSVTLEAGKRVMKWGKGYAWNPAGFVSRPKDPNDPEETLEGYGMLNADLIKSFDGPLQTIAFTPVVIPVTDFGNTEWGKRGSFVGAAKLYFLFMDTDIDLMLLAGESTTTRAGLDFSKNITSDFEVHGESAVEFDAPRSITDSQGNLRQEKLNAWSHLLGVRYLNSYDTTFIFEYYRNGLGYSRSEMKDYYSFVQSALGSFSGGNPAPLKKSKNYGLTYNLQSAMQDYLYLRISQKEPFDILYFTPALTSIYNMDDRSFSISPELVYSPTTNLEFRLKTMLTFGGADTEYGEKINSSKTELRLRYYF